MFTRLLLCCMLFAFTSSVYAQEEKLGFAILLDYESIKDPYSQKVYKAFEKKLNASERSDYQFYHWEEKMLNPRFRTEESKKDPRPCDKVVFLKLDVRANKNVDLSLTVDTSGQTTRAYFLPEFSYLQAYKMIDLGTSKIELADVDQPSKTDLKVAPVEIKDFKGFFKSDPSRLKRANPKEYRKKVVELRQKYAEEIEKSLAKATSIATSRVYTIVSKLKSSRDTRLFKIQDYDKTVLEGKKKLKQFVIDAGTEDDLRKGEYLDVVRKVNYGDYVAIEKIDQTYVDVASEKTSACKSVVFTGKKLTEALRNEDEIYLSRSDLLLKELNRSQETIRTVAVDKTCLFCAISAEEMLVKLSNVELLERNYGRVQSYFLNLAKSEKYMDFDIDKIQGRQKGVRYVLDIQSNKISATDVETGRVFTEAPKTNNDGGLMKFMKMNSGFATSKMISRLFLDLFEKEIETVQILQEKKDKVKNVLAYHPIGFFKEDRFRIYEVSEEKVKDKTIERKTLIGQALVKELKSNHIADLMIFKGKKEVSKALKTNKKITFIHE